MLLVNAKGIKVSVGRGDKKGRFGCNWCHLCKMGSGPGGVKTEGKG